MEIVQRFISCNYTKGREGKTPIQITFHTAVAKTDSLFAWFNNPRNKTSTHYYINKYGIVEQYVREFDTAWSNSNWNANIRSITIETWDNAQPFDSVRTPEMYESCSQLLVDLYNRYKTPLIILTKEQSFAWQSGLTLHKYFANKSCPAGLDIQRIINRAKEILNPPIILETMTHKPVKYKVIKPEGLPIRKEPTKNSEQIDRLNFNETIEISAFTKGGNVQGIDAWANIRGGYCSSYYLEPLSDVKLIEIDKIIHS